VYLGGDGHAVEYIREPAWLVETRESADGSGPSFFFVGPSIEDPKVPERYYSSVELERAS
jgi:hypothetical protein